MELRDPVLTVLLCSSVAAATAVFGVLPFAFHKRVGLEWIGGAYALASGLMLGVAYLLMTRGLERGLLLAMAGAGLGVAYTYWVQSYAGITQLDTMPGRGAEPDYGYRIILQNTLHSASEGVAIGVAMLVSLKLGIFMAFALAIHNIGEAMALTAFLRDRGMSTGESAGLCVVTNVGQVLLAIVAFAVGPMLGDRLPAALGFAAGALLFLVMTELLPASYQRAKSESVAFLLSFSVAAVVLLESFFL